MRSRSRPARPARSSARRPSPPALDLRSLPGPETILREELPNGIVVLVRENFSSPSVVVSGFLPVGSIDDPRPQAGLADLTASALMRGTERWSFRELYERIESVGASLGFGAGKHSTSFQGKALAEDLGLLLDTAAEALQRPAFPPAEVGRLRGEKLTALAIRDQDTGARAAMAFEEKLYPGHPYSVPDEGYTETVAALTPARLRTFQKARYGPKGMVIAVVGAVRARAARDAVAERFGGWEAARSRRRPGVPMVGAPQAAAMFARYSARSRGHRLLPSVPPDRPEFEPARYWRGPVWINTNWLVARGLEALGLRDEAQTLVDATLDLVRTAGWHEYFHASSGEGLGGGDFSWTAALVTDLLLRPLSQS